jgi:galactosylceramidase
LQWLQAARTVHNLTIDFVGIWNERGYTTQYIISLHEGIRAANLSTKIVGHDSGWDICAPVNSNPALATAVDVIGAHYPGTHSDPACQTTGKPLWASEDYSKAWNTGGQCMARVISQNYVRANITSTIAWNLFASYYDELPVSASTQLHSTSSLPSVVSL